MLRTLQAAWTASPRNPTPGQQEQCPVAKGDHGGCDGGGVGAGLSVRELDSHLKMLLQGNVRDGTSSHTTGHQPGCLILLMTDAGPGSLRA